MAQQHVAALVHVVDHHAAEHRHNDLLHLEVDLVGGGAVIVNNGALGITAHQLVIRDLTRTIRGVPVLAGGQTLHGMAQQHVAVLVHVVDHHVAEYGFRLGLNFRHGRGGQVQRESSKGGSARFVRRAEQIHIAGKAHAVKAGSIHRKERHCTVQRAVAAVHGLGKQRYAGIPVDVLGHLSPVHHLVACISGINHHCLGIAVPVRVVDTDHRQGGYIHRQCGDRGGQLADQHQQRHQPCSCSLDGLGERFVHPVLLLLSPGSIGVLKCKPLKQRHVLLAFPLAKRGLNAYIYCTLQSRFLSRKHPAKFPFVPYAFCICYRFLQVLFCPRKVQGPPVANI